MRDIQFTSIRKKEAQSGKKYKNHWQAEYHHIQKKGRKTLLSDVHGTRTWDLSFMT